MTLDICVFSHVYPTFPSFLTDVIHNYSHFISNTYYHTNPMKCQTSQPYLCLKHTFVIQCKEDDEQLVDKSV